MSSQVNLSSKLPNCINTKNPGGSTGIGRATAQLCVELGAHVVIGDINPPNPAFENSENPRFLDVDVTNWESQRNLFIQTEKQFGRIDHVFANAGIRPRPVGFNELSVDDDGLLQPPDMKCIDVNLNGPIYTVQLARAYMTKLASQPVIGSGSIVISCSASSMQTFSASDYTIAKHGALGIIRGLSNTLRGKIRLNAIAPSWTETAIVPSDFMKSIGIFPQSPEVVARSAVMLFADTTRHGDLIYSWDGKYREINNAPGGLLEHVEQLLPNAANEEKVLVELSRMSAAQKEAAAPQLWKK